MAAPTCGDCGAPMRQNYARVCGPSGSQAIPLGLECSSRECQRKQLAQDRADEAQRSEAALQKALASGLIVPDDTPEAERYV